MFTEHINNLTICGDEATEVFPNILKFFDHPDNSFLATLRAMLPKRMSFGDVLRFGLERHRLDDDFHTQTARNMVYTLFRQAVSNSNCLIISSLEDTDRGILDTIKTKAPDVYPAYTYLPEVSYYLSQKGCRKEAFISEQHRSAIIIGTTILLSDWHYVQSVIPKLLPWYFTEPRTQDDNAILHSLTKTSSQDYLAIMERISMGMDLRAIKIRKMLAGFAQDYRQDRINETERKIAELVSEIARLNQELSQKITTKYESQITLCGLQCMDGPQDVELIDFFLKNKALHLVSVERGVVEYIITGYMNSFDMHIFERYMDNTKSVFYNRITDAKITIEETKNLLKAIFNPNPMCKLRVCAAFKLKLGASLSPKMNYAFPVGLNTYLPHPHIDRSGCLGGNSEYINQAMANQDYLTAIIQTMAALRNMNFADGVVVPRLIEGLRKDNPVCIEMRSGEILRPSEAVKHLD